MSHCASSFGPLSSKMRPPEPLMRWSRVGAEMEPSRSRDGAESEPRWSRAFLRGLKLSEVGAVEPKVVGDLKGFLKT